MREIDSKTIEMEHAARFNEEVHFFTGLTGDQLTYLAHILHIIAASDGEARAYAQRFLGTTEAYLAICHKMCTCGKKHDDAEALAKMLDDESKKP